MESNRKLLNQLRIHFVSFAMLAIFIVTVIVVGMINMVHYFNTMDSINGMIELISMNGGKIPEFETMPQMKPDNKDQMPDYNNAIKKHNPDLSEETKYITRFFTATIDTSGDITTVNLDNTARFNEETAVSVTEEIISSGKEKGWDGDYYYRIITSSDSKMLVYLDCSKEYTGCRELLMISVAVAFISLVVEVIILSILSQKVVKPVVESNAKQKQFITDASHELKTPLTIILANLEVLELTEGKNEWTDSIKKQTRRMTKLVNDMVYLAKMDEDRIKFVTEEFNLSDAAADVALSFKTPAENKGVTFESSFEEGILFNGDEAGVRQLISILMDNAVKYVNEKGKICVSLKSGHKNTTLEIYNTCHSFNRDELPKLFERFYRIDKSRSRETGGSGIGLSVAEAIVASHKNMSINVETEDCKSILFRVNFK
ncbi:MAG: sensor histidine kinase [Lachnospiraceae bacterium]